MKEDELKTLKDLDRIVQHEEDGNWLNEEELKAEAVKWVKEDIKIFGLLNGIPAITKEWMRRLNITEDDLK